MTVPDARWEITSTLAPLLEDKGHFSWVGARQCNSVKQSPQFKTFRTTGPLHPLWIAPGMVHPLGICRSGCKCVGGPSENADECVVGIVSARLWSSPPQIKRDCFCEEETEQRALALKDKWLVLVSFFQANFVCILRDYTHLQTLFYVVVHSSRPLGG